MIEIQWRPLRKWPENWKPPASDYKASKRYAVANVRQILDRELGQLGTNLCIIESDHAPDVRPRIDGFPRMADTPMTGRVQVLFEVRGQTRVMRNALYWPDLWLTNVYLIGMTLQRMREMRNYACVTVEEQFGGLDLAALPAGPESWMNMTVETDWQALDVLVKASGVNRADGVGGDGPRVRKELYQEAAKKWHPDKGTGSAAAMAKITEAYRFLSRGA